MKTSEDFSFGSKAFNELHHGRNKDGKRKSDTAHRAKEGYRKAQTKKGEAEALQAFDAENEAHARKLARLQRQEDRITARILDSGGYAVKIALPEGVFTAADVAHFEAQGWTVYPAGSVSAKPGTGLPAIRTNPGAVLGPEGTARALVIAGPEPLSEDTLFAWRRAGYELAPAPLKYRRGPNRPKAKAAKPPKEETPEEAKRGRSKALAQDRRERLERVRAQIKGIKAKPPLMRDRLKLLELQGRESEYLREALDYEREAKKPRAKTNPEPADQKRVYNLLKTAKAPMDVETVAERAKTTAPEALASLQRLEALGLAHQADFSLFGALWAPGAPQRSLFANPGPKKIKKVCHKAPYGTMKDTRKKRKSYTESMRKTATLPKAKPNPDPLSKIWEEWTGAKAGTTITLNMEQRGHVPDRVVMLGRVSELIAKDGRVLFFAERGPFLVTDAKKKNLWLVDAKKREFCLNLSGGLIGYLAKKPKFGDREPVKYIHTFTGKASATMAGQTGEIAGSFKITDRGIEG